MLSHFNGEEPAAGWLTVSTSTWLGKMQTVWQPGNKTCWLSWQRQHDLMGKDIKTVVWKFPGYFYFQVISRLFAGYFQVIFISRLFPGYFYFQVICRLFPGYFYFQVICRLFPGYFLISMLFQGYIFGGGLGRGGLFFMIYTNVGQYVRT